MKSVRYLTNEQLIFQLRKQGLIIDSDKRAEKLFNEIGYHKLILGYRKPFVAECVPKEYLPNVGIDDICFLYRFDKELKELLLKNICAIEVTFKTQFSNFVSSVFGLGLENYLDVQFYQDIKTRSGVLRFAKCRENIIKALQKNTRHRCLKHFDVAVDSIPFWTLSTVLSFGDMTSLYSHLLPKYQSQIAKYWRINYVFLKSALDILRMYRNACAHNEVVFDFKTMGFNLKTKQIRKLYKMFNISSTEEKYENGTDNLLAVIFIFKVMLPKEDFKVFMEQYNSILKELKKIKNENALAKILEILNVPKDVDKLVAYKFQPK